MAGPEIRDMSFSSPVHALKVLYRAMQTIRTLAIGSSHHTARGIYFTECPTLPAQAGLSSAHQPL